uniref:Secreted protein n=1 Tax=Heterorhabditis bacteriophora TaxID=37862 RepID=A0A1I7X1R5_HETBA
MYIFLFIYSHVYFGRQLLRSIPSEGFGNKLDTEIKNASWVLDGTDPALHISNSHDLHHRTTAVFVRRIEKR